MSNAEAATPLIIFYRGCAYDAEMNKTCCDCGAYALKHLECSLLGLNLILVDDEIIMGCKQKIGVDLWKAAHDPIFAEVMTRYVPSPWERSEVFDLEDD
ncbi:hypothetical protein F2Q68_00013709 [Brassica cretica]|uniref:Ubiquitin-like protease family profile domain-containing protein n=1 Tax=Brassica cretica TaxID=69181 RepID=A0A8S9HIA0_BRACR|nr:hypothetical protein F2Q68_00013709 [Brassica cretica]